MNKIKDLTIVSLSRGILGESFIKHELDIGLKRLNERGITVHFSKHALSGMSYISEHPESRAPDLLDAFAGDTDMILCAVGGDDTYRLLPYLFGHDELKNVVKEKVFLGFSDTTMNHLMLHKAGLKKAPGSIQRPIYAFRGGVLQHHPAFGFAARYPDSYNIDRRN